MDGAGQGVGMLEFLSFNVWFLLISDSYTKQWGSFEHSHAYTEYGLIVCISVLLSFILFAFSLYMTFYFKMKFVVIMIMIAYACVWCMCGRERQRKTERKREGGGKRERARESMGVTSCTWRSEDIFWELALSSTMGSECVTQDIRLVQNSPLAEPSHQLLWKYIVPRWHQPHHRVVLDWLSIIHIFPDFIHLFSPPNCHLASGCLLLLVPGSRAMASWETFVPSIYIQPPVAPSVSLSLKWKWQCSYLSDVCAQDVEWCKSTQQGLGLL